MALLLLAAIASIAFGVLAVAYRLLPTELRRPAPSAIAVGLLAPAAWAALVAGEATGLAVWDAITAAAWSVALGLLASVGDRRALVVAAGTLAVAAGLGSEAIIAAGVALGLAGAIATMGIRLPAPKALAGGLIGVAALQLDWPETSSVRLALAAAVAVVLAVSGLARVDSSTRRRVLAWGAGTALAALLASAGVGVQALRARDELDAATSAARDGLAAARDGRMADAAQALHQARDGFRSGETRLDSLVALPARLVPGIARNHRAALAMARSGASLAAIAARAAIGGDADDIRLRDGALDLRQVDRLRSALADLDEGLQRASSSLDDAGSVWLLPPLEHALDDMATEVDGAASSSTTTVRILRRLPDLLGADEPRRWFVGVLGNSEARATGGIIGSHGVLETSGGALTLGPMRRTSELNNAGDHTLRGVDEYVERYGKYEPERTWQNITLSPDGPTVASVVEQLYPSSGGEPVDGVILVDPFGLAALLRLTGPVAVDAWPEPITADALPAVMLHEQYVRFERPERVDFLGDVARAAFQRLTDGELPGPIRLAAELGPAVRDGHLVLHSTEASEQTLFERLGADGAMPPVDGDAFALVTQNASGNKIDWFLRRSITYDVAVDDAGSARADVTITLADDAPATGEPDYVIAGSGLDPTAPGVNHMIVSVYSPLALESSSIELEAERELGRNVYSAFVTIPPGSETTLQLTLEGRLALRDGYRIDVREQPTVVPDDLVVRVNGKDLE